MTKPCLQHDSCQPASSLASDRKATTARRWAVRVGNVDAQPCKAKISIPSRAVQAATRVENKEREWEASRHQRDSTTWVTAADGSRRRRHHDFGMIIH